MTEDQIKELKNRISELEAARFAYASEFSLNADGEPDVGSIHANIRAMKARLAAPTPQAPVQTAAEIRSQALEDEVKQLRAALEKKHASHFLASQALHNTLVGNQSAWIEWQHGAGAEQAMAWIHNGLVGPGLIPSGTEAQPWFDANEDSRLEIPPMKVLAGQQVAQGEKGGD